MNAEAINAFVGPFLKAITNNGIKPRLIEPPVAPILIFINCSTIASADNIAISDISLTSRESFVEAAEKHIIAEAKDKMEDHVQPNVILVSAQEATSSQTQA